MPKIKVANSKKESISITYLLYFSCQGHPSCGCQHLSDGALVTMDLKKKSRVMDTVCIKEQTDVKVEIVIQIWIPEKKSLPALLLFATHLLHKMALLCHRIYFSQNQTQSRTVLGSMMPNWLHFPLLKLIKNWQFLAKKSFKLRINFISGMRLNFFSLGVCASICR